MAYNKGAKSSLTVVYIIQHQSQKTMCDMVTNSHYRFPRGIERNYLKAEIILSFFSQDKNSIFLYLFSKESVHITVHPNHINPTSQ